MSEKFKGELVIHARKAVDRAKQVQNEAGTQQSLILPFLRLLGYEPYDPSEVVPEANASFSDKFKNRADYAICSDNKPVIAIECKTVGSLQKANKGELKGYYNAVPSVKLGILTDGIIFQLFSDVLRQNMMDDDPFVVVDLKEVAEEHISENAFDALLKLRKGVFDPADVGADAQRKLYIAAYLDVLEEAFRQPQSELVKQLMDLVGVKGNKVAKLVEEHTAVISEAMAIFLDKKLLERVGFADRDVVKKVPEINKASDDEPFELEVSDVVTTDTELRVFDYVKHRLPFLIDRDENLFEQMDHIFMKDRKTVFNVSYKQENKGKLFGLKEKSNPKYRFSFPEKDINTDNLSDIDSELLATFLRRVEELG